MDDKRTKAAAALIGFLLIVFIYNISQSFKVADFSGPIKVATTFNSNNNNIDFIQIEDSLGNQIDISIDSRTKIFENKKRVRNSDFYLYPGAYIEVEKRNSNASLTAKAVNVVRDIN